MSTPTPEVATSSATLPMHDPSSDATDPVGLRPVGVTLLPEIAPPMLAPMADPTSDADATLDEPVIASQVAKTDDALRAWRDESVRRREAWEREQAVVEAEVDRRRRKWTVLIAGGASLGALAGAVVVAGIALWTSGDAAIPAPEPQVEVAAATRPAVVALPVVAPAVVAPPVVAPVEPANVPVPEPEVVPFEEPVVAVADAGLRDAKVWTDSGYVWASFVHSRPWAVTLRWLDANGVSALEPMGCARSECRAARSHARLQTALAAGAAPGTWTVQACADGSCSALGTFQVQ